MQPIKFDFQSRPADLLTDDTIEANDAHFTSGCILMLDEGALGLSYATWLVYNCPRSIASKEGNKTLPQELWLDIIERAKNSDYSNCSNNYRLVELMGLSLTSPTALVFRKLTTCEPLGELPSREGVRRYERAFLDTCYGTDTRLFKSPSPDDIIKIDFGLLQMDIDILFCRVQVSDVISRVEKGKCELCLGHRWIRPETPLRAIWARQKYMDRYHGFGPNSGDVICPLCIDRGPSERTLVRRAISAIFGEQEQGVADLDEDARRWFVDLGYSPRKIHDRGPVRRQVTIYLHQ